MDIALTPQLEELVRSKVETGMYESPSEVVRDALRLLKQRDDIYAERLAELRREIDIGIREADAGLCKPMNAEEIIEEGRRMLSEKYGKAS